MTDRRADGIVIGVPEKKAGPTDTDPIVRVTDRVLDLNITGYLMPVDVNAQPCYMHMSSDSTDTFVVLFSTPEKFQATQPKLATFHKLVQIQDSAEFLSSIPAHIRVAVDPWTTERGTTRFVEIFR